MNSSILRRIEQLEGNQELTGLSLMVRFDGIGTPTHYRTQAAWDVERWLRTGQRPPLAYLFVAHVTAAWVPEPEAHGYHPLPEQLHESAEALIHTLSRGGVGSQVHRVEGKSGSLDSQSPPGVLPRKS
jgi:hypothetical protein